MEIVLGDNLHEILAKIRKKKLSRRQLYFRPENGKCWYCIYKILSQIFNRCFCIQDKYFDSHILLTTREMLPVFKEFYLTCDFKIKAGKDNLEKKNNIHKYFNNIAPKWKKALLF